MEAILSDWEAGGFNKIYRLSAEEVEVFKAAVADVTEQFKGIYGADACAAFDIA